MCLATAPFWCTVAYFEERHYVGEAFQAFTKPITVDGFASPGLSDRYCVGQFTNIHRSKKSKQTRKLIGNGIKLNLIDGQVILTNQSSRSVFVCSGVINVHEGQQPNVVLKVRSGEELVVYRYDFQSISYSTIILLLAQVQEFLRYDTLLSQ